MRKDKHTFIFQLTLEVPAVVTAQEAQQYIRDAVRQWGKGGDPDATPLNQLKDEQFTVSLREKRVTYA